MAEMRKPSVQTVPKCQCSSKYLKDLDAKVKNLVKEFVLNDIQLKELLEKFNAELLKGLAADTHDQADMKCYPTYLHTLPTGEEDGLYLTLYLGPEHLTIFAVTLDRGNVPNVVKEEFTLPEKIITSTADDLSDYLAECLATFIQNNELNDENLTLALGFIFDFPYAQRELDKAEVVAWRGKFNVPDVLGQDVGQMLKDAISRRDLHIECVCILTYTTATLMAQASGDMECRIAVTLENTMTNACYNEKTVNVKILDPKLADDSPYTLISTEWGALGENGDTLDFLRTRYDRIVDAATPDAGKRTFEKMIAGSYMCELLRLILIDAIKEDMLFATCPNNVGFANILESKINCIESFQMSQIEEDTYPEFKNTKNILKNLLGIEKPVLTDIQIIKYLVHVLFQRSASLAAVGLCGLIHKVGEMKVTVAADGCLYKYNPKYSGYMREVITKLLDPNIACEVVFNENGKCQGAALAVAVSSLEPAPAPSTPTE